MSCHGAGTVGLFQPTEVPSLDGAGIAFTFACAAHVHFLSGGEQIGLEDLADLVRLGNQIFFDEEADIAALVRRCQQLRIEPFGFAERVATRFLTVDDWLAWNWRERFSSADVDVCVTLPATGA